VFRVNRPLYNVGRQNSLTGHHASTCLSNYKKGCIHIVDCRTTKHPSSKPDRDTGFNQTTGEPRKLLVLEFLFKLRVVDVDKRTYARLLLSAEAIKNETRWANLCGCTGPSTGEAALSFFYG
jgi:hypothetical protein